MTDDSVARPVTPGGRSPAGRGRSRHSAGGDRWSRAVVLAVTGLVVLLAVGLRWSLRSFVSWDMNVYVVPWYDYLRHHGISAFGQGFTNYNFPYPFLLFLVSRLPVSAVTGIKMISLVFDLLLAGTAGLLVRQLTGSVSRATVTGLVMLFLPTVMLNSAVWGQCDAIYTTFGLAALYAALRGRGNVAWALLGVALAFKLQAIFFVPALVLLWLRRKTSWYAPAFAVLAWLTLSVPPVFFGRSVGETLGVYLAQSDYYQWLSAGLPNAYAWLPGAELAMFKTAGNLFAVALMGLMLLVAFRAPGRYAGGSGVVLFAAVSAAVAVYTIPQMHERYTYVYEVLVLVLVAVTPRYLWLVATSQAAAMYGYSAFLFGRPFMPDWSAALLLGATVVGLLTIWVMSLVREPIASGAGEGPLSRVADEPALAGFSPSVDEGHGGPRHAAELPEDGSAASVGEATLG